ncbi:MAG: UDP-glucose 4-epimerase [Actinomycetota bacterium]
MRAVVRRTRPYLPADEQVVLDVRERPDALRSAFEACDAVLHLAGANEVDAAEDPDAALADTVLGSRHVAAAATDAGVGRLTYVSTVHVYGRALVDGAVITEDVVPAPMATYGIARLASEHVIRAEAGRGSMEVVALRLTNGVGAPVDPRVARWTLVGNDLCRQAALDGRLVLRSSGVQWRDFIAIADVMRAVGSAVAPGGLPDGTYNLGSGAPMTILDLAALVQDAIEEETGKRPPLEAPPAPDVRPLPYHVDVDRLARLGVTPQVSIASAMAETARFCLEHREAL